MQLTSRVIDLICHFESLHDGDLTKIGAQPKMDPIGIWTYGYGHVLYNRVTGKPYKGEGCRAEVERLYPGCSDAEARVLLRSDLPGYEQSVLHMIRRRDLADHEYEALVSFAYNCGTHYKNALGIAVPYKLWSLVDSYTQGEAMRTYWATSVVKAGGKVWPGLVRRRRSEGWLYTTGQVNFFN